MKELTSSTLVRFELFSVSEVWEIDEPASRNVFFMETEKKKYKTNHLTLLFYSSIVFL